MHNAMQEFNERVQIVYIKIYYDVALYRVIDDVVLHLQVCAYITSTYMYLITYILSLKKSPRISNKDSTKRDEKMLPDVELLDLLSQTIDLLGDVESQLEKYIESGTNVYSHEA